MDDSGYAIIVLLVLAFLIFLCVMLIKKSAEDSQKMEVQYMQILQALPQDQQMTFSMQYQNVKKSTSTGILLALFLGGIGAHWFYMGRTGRGVVYLLFCWTFIPGILAIFDAIGMSNTVKKYNLEKAMQISAMMSGHGSAYIQPMGL